MKLSQFGSSQYVFVFLGVGLTALIVFGGLSMILCKKKPVKKERERDRKKNH